MSHVLITAPGSEPVSLNEAKDHLRIPRTNTDEDNYLNAVIPAARSYAEEYMSRALITQTWELQLERFPCGDKFGGIITVPRAPLASVTTLKYVATDGTLTTLSSSAYVVDTTREPGRVTPVWNTFWPTTRFQPGAVQVRYVAGWADAASVPDAIKQYIKLLIGSMYSNRESEVTGTITASLGFAESLLSPFKMYGF